MFHTPAHKQTDPAKLPGQLHFEPAAPYAERRRATLDRIEEAMRSIEAGCRPDGLAQPGEARYISPHGGGCLMTWLLGPAFYHAIAATVAAYPRTDFLSVTQLPGEALFCLLPYADAVGLDIAELRWLQTLYDTRSESKLPEAVRGYIKELRDYA